jgi:hypothetical protein
LLGEWGPTFWDSFWSHLQASTFHPLNMRPGNITQQCVTMPQKNEDINSIAEKVWKVTIFFMCGWCICQVVFDLHVSLWI